MYYLLHQWSFPAVLVVHNFSPSNPSFKREFYIHQRHMVLKKFLRSQEDDPEGEDAKF